MLTILGVIMPILIVVLVINIVILLKIEKLEYRMHARYLTLREYIEMNSRALERMERSDYNWDPWNTDGGDTDGDNL